MAAGAGDSRSELGGELETSLEMLSCWPWAGWQPRVTEWRSERAHNIAVMAATQILLSLLLASLTSPSWATSQDGETAGQDIDLGQMLQLGLSLGKQYLGEAGMEKLKKGDFSELMDLGEKFLGEGGVNSLVSAAAKEFLNVEEKDWLKTGADSGAEKVR